MACQGQADDYAESLDKHFPSHFALIYPYRGAGANGVRALLVYIQLVQCRPKHRFSIQQSSTTTAFTHHGC